MHEKLICENVGYTYFGRAIGADDWQRGDPFGQDDRGEVARKYSKLTSLEVRLG